VSRHQRLFELRELRVEAQRSVYAGPMADLGQDRTHVHRYIDVPAPLQLARIPRSGTSPACRRAPLR
jgi:hypothetical protein